MSTSSHCPFLDHVYDIKLCFNILDDQCMTLVVVSEENWRFWGGQQKGSKI